MNKPVLVYAPPELGARAARLIAATGVVHVDPNDWFYFKRLRTPAYLQNRDLTKYPQWPEILRCMADFVRWVSDTKGYPSGFFEGVHGVPDGATLLSGALAYELRVGAIRIQKEMAKFKFANAPELKIGSTDLRDKTRYGIALELYGICRGQRAFGLEDAIVSGGSAKGKCVDPLQELGVIIEHLFAFASFGIEAAETLLRARLPVSVYSLCPAEVIFGEVLRADCDDHTRHVIREWFEDPEAASKKYIDLPKKPTG